MQPHAPDIPPVTPTQRRDCERAIRNGSRSFFAASLLLPKRVRRPALALYAFCRLADDAIDRSDAPHEALASLRARLDRVYAGRPMDVDFDGAFAEVVGRHGIPRTLPEALLEGFEWDTENRRYRDLPELQGYAARVAGSVGAMMSILMGARSPRAIARACDLGVAMQLTNIARDVGEDARAGRIYLPLAWLREAGIDPDRWLARPVHDPALAGVVARLLRRADLLYARANTGIACLPRSCRPAIRLASRLYAEIGHEVRRRGHDAISGRAVVSPTRKVLVLGRAAAGLAAGTRVAGAPPLEATRYLVEAVDGSAPPDGYPPSVWRRVDERAGWVIDLFIQLERRQRSRALAAAARAP